MGSTDSSVVGTPASPALTRARQRQEAAFLGYHATRTQTDNTNMAPIAEAKKALSLQPGIDQAGIQAT